MKRKFPVMNILYAIEPKLSEQVKLSDQCWWELQEL